MAPILRCVVCEVFERRRGKDGWGDNFVATVYSPRLGYKDSVSESSSSSSAMASTSGGVGGSSDGTFYLLFLNNDVVAAKPNLLVGVEKLTKLQRVIFTNVFLSKEVKDKQVQSGRLTGDSKILTSVSAFPYSASDVKQFLEPDVITVAAARGSPTKRRLSVTADVSVVQSLTSTDTYKRRKLVLEGSGCTIDVTLWGSHAAKEWSPSKAVTFVGLFKGDDGRLATTSSTTVKFSGATGERDEIIAISNLDSGFPIEVVLESGIVLSVNEDITFDFVSACKSLPVTVRYSTTTSGAVVFLELDEDK